MASKHSAVDQDPHQDGQGELKRRGGRPAKTAAERQQHAVVVRFSEAVFAQLESHARVKGQTLAGVVKQWMAHGRPVGLTAEQHAQMRCLPQICNDLQVIAALLKERSGHEQQVKPEDLLALREQLGQLLTSFQR